MQPEAIQGLRLSPQQKRLWLLQQGGREYHAQCAVLIEGALDAERLRETLHGAVERHEILRTTFRRRAGIRTPLQFVNDEGAVEWRVLDPAAYAGASAEASAELLFDEQAARPFDFAAGPLLRAGLLALSARRHLLLLDLPAACADAPTLHALVGEIGRRYDPLSAAEDEGEEPLQYADYAEWQNELLETGESEADAGRDFWQEADYSSYASLRLPFERPAAEEAPRPRARALHVPAELRRAVEEAARLCGATPADSLRACWQVLLSRLTGRGEVVTFELSEGRKYEELRGSLGLFDRWLPIKCLCEARHTLRDLIAQNARSLQDASDWQEFFDAGQVLKAAGDFESAPAAPVGFEFAARPPAVETSGTSFTICAQSVCFERFKLRLSLFDAGDQLVGKLHYDPEQFDAAEVELLAARYETLLRAAARRPEAHIDELDILGEGERRLLLSEWNRPRPAAHPEACIHQLFEGQARLTPESVALVFEDMQLTYRQLDERANQFARYLLRGGVGPESVVAFCLERSAEVVVTMLGILKAGGAYLPLDPVMPKARLDFMLEDAGARLLITQESLLGGFARTAARVVCLEREEAAVAQESAEPAPGRATAANAAYALFTSGSTGKPKAVVIEHRQLVNYTHGVMERLRLPAGVSFAMISTFAADLGNTAIYPTLCSGGSLHVISQERTANAGSLANYFRRHRIDCLKIVPSHLAALMTYSQPEQVLPRQRLVLGGESSSRELIDRVRALAPDCDVINHYGPTETTVGVLTHRVEDEAADAGRRGAAPVPLGRPIDGVRAYVLDSRLSPQPVGLAGELYIGGAAVGRGYLRRPALTAERFVPDPHSGQPGARLYRTGDSARVLAGGEVEFLGRGDGQVKVRGHRVELREVEQAVRDAAGVREALVLAREDEPGDKRLVAYLAGGGDERPSAGRIRSALKERLPDYMVPAAFVFLDALPLSPNGKLDRRALPAPGRDAGAEADTPFVAPRTAVEEVLAGIWRRVLGLDRVGVNDNFFDLGGHSLSAAKVVTRVRESFQTPLTLRHVLENPTVAASAAFVTSQETKPGRAEKIAKAIKKIESLSAAHVSRALRKREVEKGAS
jgi:amino acid adenylation domain-containing protein